MHPLTDIAHHGYVALAAVVFLEAVGLPVPAAVALVAAGAAAAAHDLNFPAALLLAITCMVTGDALMYVFGRLSGWWLLGILCRVSLNPESCIYRSAERFHRRGRLTLVLAKFIPGINTMAPPMAGSMRMPVMRFLSYDAAGALLYGGAYLLAGFVFGDVIEAIYRRAAGATQAVEWAAIAAAAAYVAYRIVLYVKHRRADIAPRVTVQQLAERARENPNILIADVRSHGYYSHGAKRIPGSRRMEPSTLLLAADALPRDREIYLYCT